MKDKTLKWSARGIIVTTVLFCGVYFFLPTIRAESYREQEEVFLESYEAQVENIAIEEIDTGEELLTGLMLSLPEGIRPQDVIVNKDDLTQILKIEIPHTDAEYFQNNPIVGSSDFIEDLTYAQGKDTDIIEVHMDKVYEIDIKKDSQYYYFEFIDLRERYENIVVIDAGHGGNDPGATKLGVMEKDIDLAILLELKALFDQSTENIKVYYTRTDDSNPSRAKRVGLANKTQADLFISIHNNASRSGRMSSINGTEVMYQKNQEGAFTSEDLAEICMEELTLALESRKRSLVDGNEIHIIRNSEVPVALVEIGFMTNREELKRLSSEEYQKKAAEALYQAVIKALKRKGKAENE